MFCVETPERAFGVTLKGEFSEYHRYEYNSGEQHSQCRRLHHWRGSGGDNGGERAEWLKAIGLLD